MRCLAQGHFRDFQLGGAGDRTGNLPVTSQSTLYLLSHMPALNSLPLSCQTFGSGNLLRVGLVVQRALLILLLACLPCWAVLVNTELILLAVRQSPEVSRYVSPSAPTAQQNP